MKKILFILFVTFLGLFAKSQDVQVYYTNVLHSDTSFLIKVTNTYQLDSQLRYIYTNHWECDSALVQDTMRWVCNLILDTTSYWYPFKTLTGTVRDSTQISQPKIRDTLVWLRNQMFNLIGDNSTALGRNIINLSNPASNSVVVATSGGNAITRTASEILSDINALATNGNGSSLTGLTKTQVGLGNVDNTSDLLKPISTATQIALDLKQNSLGFTPYNATNPNGYISSINSGNVTTALGFTPIAANGNGSSLTGLTKTQVGLANVDNTSDANKPI